MPVCYITLSENKSELTDKEITSIRRIVAKGLNSNARKLDEMHISIRKQKNIRAYMLADLELDIFSQAYFRRLLSRDKRANFISKKISEHLQCSCATWINMGFVGYSRVSEKGDSFYSDSDNWIMRFIQKIKGVSTSIKL